jgi:hypothetical protein
MADLNGTAKPCWVTGCAHYPTFEGEHEAGDAVMGPASPASPPRWRCEAGNRCLLRNARFNGAFKKMASHLPMPWT